MNIKISNRVPENIVLALIRKGSTHYSDLVTIFHCIELHSEHWVGVAGDGANGAYEWFVVRDGKLTTSNAGYSSSFVALRDVLQKEAA